MGEQAVAGESTTDAVATLKSQIEELEKRGARSDLLLAMAANERTYFDGLDAAGQEAYLGKSADERTADMAAAEKALTDTDPVEFTDASGRQYRKSAGVEVIELAKRYDALEKREAAKDAALGRVLVTKEAEELFPESFG